MKRPLYLFAALAAFALIVATNFTKPHVQPKVQVGVIVPMDHAALRKIVEGFEKTLKKTHPEVSITVSNAQGDLNTQRVIIEQMVQNHYDVLVPIGMGTTQMSAKLSKGIPVISLAAVLPADERPPNVSGITDELGAATQLAFAQQALGDLKAITLIHSPSEKIYPEVEQLRQLCEKASIKLQTLMIQNLTDLYPIASSVEAHSQLLLVLKDHLVVSGMASLSQTAEKLHLPLMASDEGSVSQGAAFALGVSEEAIGEAGSALVSQLLEGAGIETIAPQKLHSLYLFINRQAMKEQGVSEENLQQAAKACGYTIHSMEP